MTHYHERMKSLIRSLDREGLTLPRPRGPHAHRVGRNVHRDRPRPRLGFEMLQKLAANGDEDAQERIDDWATD